MFHKSYSNFVRASALEEEQRSTIQQKKPVLSGDEARRIYLEEIKNGSTTQPSKCKTGKHKKVDKEEDIPLTNKYLFLTVQNNDVDKIRYILDRCPDKINIVDDYGWSLLMIACQANSIETTQELLKRGVDISIRDKAGNSARSLVIKNKNYTLADILLNHRETQSTQHVNQDRIEVKSWEDYTCDICSKTFPNREEHLSSTIHNICASKGKKILPHYVIPTSNRGYQLLLKGGWDRDSGLGRDGTGKKYPIKTIQKRDRKGLGHKKNEQNVKSTENGIKVKSKEMFAHNIKKNRRLEINFRREFY
ncbi:unnamed protein product [Arctia plantaginis]|uniref:G-patch domain-containing protein n=1 Tax=Arctia plantaginis TaxID=874455 RepID=A0A8S0ZKG2_ARCPL|nr:unnamed protein product [Arctia plantaginis]